MPVDWNKYPSDWKEIALRLKAEVDWVCEGCGMQCRKPGEKFDTHVRTLTVAHLNHIESDCRPTNLIALCSGCHLRYDAPRKRFDRIVKKRLARVEIGGEQVSLEHKGSKDEKQAESMGALASTQGLGPSTGDQ